jgi:hypothetical protein
MQKKIELELRDCKQLQNGCVVLTYDVVHCSFRHVTC